jgi:hypothetical protein
MWSRGVNPIKIPKLGLPHIIPTYYSHIAKIFVVISRWRFQLAMLIAPSLEVALKNPDESPMEARELRGNSTGTAREPGTR